MLANYQIRHQATIKWIVSLNLVIADDHVTFLKGFVGVAPPKGQCNNNLQMEGCSTAHPDWNFQKIVR